MDRELAVAVGIFFDYDFSGEGTVDVGEVSGSQDHADDPPDQADFQAVVGGFRAVDGQRIDGVAGGEDHGEKTEDDTSEHAGYVEAGGEEGFGFVVLDEFELDAGEAGYR